MGSRGMIGNPNNRGMSNGHHMNGGMSTAFYQPMGNSIAVKDLPLRMLVPADMVGAIIGKGGSTIRQITHQSRARVDVHRKDAGSIFNEGHIEKVIHIYGSSEHCSTACNLILEVIQKEINEPPIDSNGDPPRRPSEPVALKILAHNNLVGRLIGKNGVIIRKIMDDSNTTISVTNGNDNRERVIVIRGTIPDVIGAQFEITQKMRRSYEHDVQQMQMMGAPYGASNVQPPMGGMSSGYHQSYQRNTIPQHSVHGYHPADSGYNHQPYFNPYNQMGYHHPMSPPRGDGVCETAHVWVPASKVGAIIGTRGTSIREITRASGCEIKVAPNDSKTNDEKKASEDESESEKDAAETSESPTGSSKPDTVQNGELDTRRVTLKGTPDAQWTAQSRLFQKIFGDSPRSFALSAEASDPLIRAGHLRVEISIPSSQVGRLIGKGGQTVKEIQRQTHAKIKLPDDLPRPQSADADASAETPVFMIGDFYAVQAAQRQIRALVARGYNGNAPHPANAKKPEENDGDVPKTQKVDGDCNTSESQC